MDIHRRLNFVHKFGCPARATPLVVLLMLCIAGCDAKRPVSPAKVPDAATAPSVQPAPQAAIVPAALTPEQRRAQQLIAQVEQTFLIGEAHYRKGQLVAAKSDFDSAVDMMLASGLEIKTDPQLDDEFNRILDAVNSLEMEALKRGNGFSPAIEPSPADVAEDVTFEVDPNLVAKAKEELATTKSDLPLVINDYVAGYINFFANSQRGHNTLRHSLERGGRYKAMIQHVLKEEGVPQDLIYLAVAESGFQPQAVNGHSGAGGMWQFMPHGDYGLKRNGYVDERFDPEKSTHAYARYMKFLYNQLGDWYLAMAAYDWGAGSIQRAVQKTGYADFWELYKRNNLPVETKNYVPEILAAIIIANNPKQYGFEDLQSDPAIVTDIVPVNYAVDLRLVADLVDAQPQEILALNPGLLRLSTPPPDILAGPYDLHLPPGTATLYRQHISEIPADRRTQWRYHRVTEEDTLASIARNFHVGVEQLATVNQLHFSDTLDNVEALVIPVPPPSSPTTHAEIYRARRGDSLVKIADRFGVSLDDLHRWNHITGMNVAAGARIRVVEPVRVASRSGAKTREVAPYPRHTNTVHTNTSHTSTSHASASHKGSKGHASGTSLSAASSKRDANPAAKEGDSKMVAAHPKSQKKKNLQK